ncbi:hypothetical protein ABGV17_04300 [Guyparkeria sp. GHLCS8-2]|uniref:hypothetical protein n=1 Tax=Guyparkeria halopsychrophila TaxID=3139421 RepID=UPI0037C6EA96
MQKPTLSEKIGTVLFIALVAFIWILVETSGEEEPAAEQPPAEEIAATDPAPTEPARPKPTADQLAAALNVVEAEPKVISAAWQDESLPSLLVGVADDGTRRDGYAESICLILAEQRVYGGVVHVLDNYAEGRTELGKHWCNTKPLAD